MSRGDVAALALDGIDWRAGELLVRGEGNRVERLPLLVDGGDALADYLLYGRRADAEGRSPFVRVKARHRAISAAAVTHVVVSVARKHEDDYLDTSAYTARRYTPELVAYMQPKSGRSKVMFATITRWSSASRRCRIWTAWGSMRKRGSSSSLATLSASSAWRR
jgi:hypothetical protein